MHKNIQPRTPQKPKPPPPSANPPARLMATDVLPAGRFREYPGGVSILGWLHLFSSCWYLWGSSVLGAERGITLPIPGRVSATAQLGSTQSTDEPPKHESAKTPACQKASDPQLKPASDKTTFLPTPMVRGTSYMALRDNSRTSMDTSTHNLRRCTPLHQRLIRAWWIWFRKRGCEHPLLSGLRPQDRF